MVQGGMTTEDSANNSSTTAPVRPVRRLLRPVRLVRRATLTRHQVTGCPLHTTELNFSDSDGDGRHGQTPNGSRVEYIFGKDGILRSYKGEQGNR
jgi:hypothetical protein